MTYNQSPFIRDALNGFAIQHTTFPFVCLVIDDASTDGQQDILKQFMAEECDMPHSENYEDDIAEYVFARHNYNKNCVFVFCLLKYNLFRSIEKELIINKWREKCQYEAICEGDDYWTYSNKLQNQVEFLDQNPDFVLSFHDVFQLDVKTGVTSPFYMPDVEQCTDATAIAKHNYICTLSVIHRIIPQVYHDTTTFGFSIIGDYPRWLLLSQYGKFYRFTERWAVYRKGVGIWSADTNLLKRNLMHLLCVSKTYGYLASNEQRTLLDIQIQGCYNTILKEYNSYVSSIDYKLGNLLLRPIRFIKRCLNQASRTIRT